MTDETFTLEEVLSATDAAIKLAEENDIDINDVKGTGADGNITKGDVEDHIEKLQPKEEKPKKASKKKTSKKKSEETKVAEDTEVEAVVSEPSPEPEVVEEKKDDAYEAEKKRINALKKAAKERREGKLSAAVRWRRLGRR